jgi:hypothetical protein
MRWWWQKDPEPSTEAQEQLQKIMDRDPEVNRLSRKLREAERRDHFSDMVDAAMARVAKEGH